ncbi:cupin domain-containing protein [Oceaniovalibus sp. ACAM 378]|uniref:cupin domain-containing protein n=1 Tax=Oceaniovalibus sp. ACAM 378 TaxID=2599923 RepID=UPI0011D822E5|nr:cupin domain-containing protein [Oceaniovalibus sp. ACAM 378]
MPHHDRPIVFLHMPKTGGQTVHHAIAEVVGNDATSPILVMQQMTADTPFPPGYRFYSGHLDWLKLGELKDPFTFSVLRDPRERLGSQYFYLRAKAEALPPEQRAMQDNRLMRPIDDFFLPPEPRERKWIDEVWGNLTTTYLATRSLKRPVALRGLSTSEVLKRALTNAGRLDAIYRSGDFEPLEQDMQALLGQRPNIASNRANNGPLEQGKSRWQAVLDLLDTDAARHAMDRLVERDLELMERLNFRTSSGNSAEVQRQTTGARATGRGKKDEINVLARDMKKKPTAAVATQLVDDDLVRITRFDFAPGAETGWHRHGMDYVITTLTECVMILEEPGGTSRTVTIAPGIAYRRAEGVEHNVINGGTAPMSFIEVEIKRPVDRTNR